MQFTVLIEFLVPGLATTLLLLFIYLGGTMPTPPQGLCVGDTASALLLLAVSYPVGILTNFPLFKLQQRLVSRKVRRRIFKKYKDTGIDLVALVSKQFDTTVINLPINDHKKLLNDHEKLQELFYVLRAFVFSKNIERIQSNHIYHEGLQRLARGILPALLLATYVIGKSQNPSKWLIVFCILLAWSACWLLWHSVKVEYERAVRYFLVLTNTKHPATVAQNEKGRTRNRIRPL